MIRAFDDRIRRPLMTPEEFWDAVEVTDRCHYFTGDFKARVVAPGISDKPRAVYWVAYELRHGRVPPKARVVTTCGILTCTRDEHLKLLKGRAAPGSTRAGKISAGITTTRTVKPGGVGWATAQLARKIAADKGVKTNALIRDLLLEKFPNYSDMLKAILAGGRDSEGLD